LWRETFTGEPECIASAPGRVNLIGEHTDYNDGYVMPAAISLRTLGLFRRVSGRTHLVSGQSGPGQAFDAGLGLSQGWSVFPAACARALLESGYPPANIEGVIWSEIPKGAGLSSSAALELCFLAAWNLLGGHDLPATRLAEVAWKAETRFVGVQCGIMDQMASALGVRGSALLIDTLQRSAVPFSLPASMEIAVLDTGKSRSLASAGYNVRVAECARAVEAIRRAGKQITSLRDAELADLEFIGDPTVRARARHVISENQRVLRFSEALATEDRESIGELMRQSHASLRDDYEVSCPELDAMVRSASTAPGCIGVRLTGAGFGGCCVALVEKTERAAFAKATLASYSIYGFPQPTVHWVEADAGARCELWGTR
jgi:galactokinase